MRKAAISALIAFLLAAGVASATTVFNSPSYSDDFCFGYAICE